GPEELCALLGLPPISRWIPSRPCPPAQRAELSHVSAGSFGGAILLAIQSQDPHGSPNAEGLLTQLLSSARSPGPKPDTNQEHLLIEAHISRMIKMNSDCTKSVCVSGSECVSHTEIDNATKLGRRCGIR